MKTLIRNARIVYPGESINGQTRDILIENDRIVSIEKNITQKGDHEVAGENLHVFPSLVDLQCSCGEPGFEDKEDLSSIDKAATAGGFGAITILPNTLPVIDHSAQVKFIESRSKNLNTDITCYGSLSISSNGSDLSEMYDMHKAGAIGFTDGKRPVADVNLMKRALEYVKGFGGAIFSFPLDERINPGAMIHESPENTRLGIKQTPALAEEIMLHRDLYLLKYTNSKMHVATISTAGSVELIRQAKAEGLNVTAGVAIHNLIYTDVSLASFDSNFKTLPPLRSESDRTALIEGLLDGTIDVIVTDHSPAVIEDKEREFDQAAYGMTMLETALPLLQKHCPKLKLNDIVSKMAIGPRSLLKRPLPKLEVGSPMDFVAYDSDKVWDYSGNNRNSKSQNSPVINNELVGRILPLN